MRKVSAALLGIAVCVIATTATAAPSAPVAKATSCVAENRNAVVEWNADRAIGAARVYFHSANAKTEHYVEMRRDGARFFAVLPQVAAGTAAIEYRVTAPDAKGAYTTRTRGVINVAKSCKATLTPAEAKQASTIIVGTTSREVIMPVGFRCDGIIGTFDEKGKLRAQKPCAEGQVAQVQVDAAVVQTSNAAPATAVNGDTKTRVSAPVAIGDEGPGVTPYHHRRERRAPQAPTAPKPRLEPPVSPSRPGGSA